MEQKINPVDFEDALMQLENIVKQIENDEVKLDDALIQYQNGMELIKYCQNKLKNVEQKVKLLDTNSNSLKDFDVE